MRVAILRASFYLPGCGSLKEKRRRLGKLRDRFGQKTGLAVCESADPDVLQRGEWTFVAAAGSSQVIEQMLSEVERYLDGGLDAQLLNIDRQWLA